MSEYIGVRGDVVGCDKGGKPLYSMYLTDEEVIRCRDCKWFGPDRSDHEYRSPWWCDRWSNDRVNPDGFCAWAERRKND